VTWNYLASSGEYSDFQEIAHSLKNLVKQDRLMDDGLEYSAKDLANYAGESNKTASIMYKKRSDMNPLWNYNVIAGAKNGQAYLGIVDMYGNKFESSSVSSGIARHFIGPLISNYYNENFDENQAKQFLYEAFKTFYARYKLSGNKFKNVNIGCRSLL